MVCGAHPTKMDSRLRGNDRVVTDPEVGFGAKENGVRSTPYKNGYPHPRV
jgi:hypothetical protein